MLYRKERRKNLFRLEEKKIEQCFAELEKKSF